MRFHTYFIYWCVFPKGLRRSVIRMVPVVVSVIMVVVRRIPVVTLPVSTVLLRLRNDTSNVCSTRTFRVSKRLQHNDRLRFLQQKTWNLKCER